MFRKMMVALVAALLMLFVGATAAMALPGDYPPEVSGTTSVVSTPESSATTEDTTEATTEDTTEATTSEIPAEVAGTTSAVVAKTEVKSGGGTLSYTGVSFNVPLTVTIATLVILAGIGLAIFGGRGAMRGRRQH